MLQIFIALNLAALIGLRVWRPEPEPETKPVCLMSPAELWELFAGLDADGSGSLDGDELGAAVKAVGAVAFTHPLGFLLLVGAASIGVRACLRRGRRTLTAVCIAANACAGARLAYHWNEFSFCCVPFFLTAAAVSRLHGAERRSFGTVSLLSILMLCKAAPFLYFAFLFLLFGGWLVERWYSRFIERWDSGYAWLVARWDDVEYWRTIWQSPSLPEWLTSFPGVFFLEGVEPFLWYAAIVALDLKVVRLLADDGGTVSYPRVLAA